MRDWLGVARQDWLSPDLLLVTSLNCGLVVGENIDDRLRASHVQFSQECRAHNIRRLVRDFAQQRLVPLVDHIFQSPTSKETRDKFSLCHLDVNFGMGSRNWNMAVHRVVCCVLCWNQGHTYIVWVAKIIRPWPKSTLTLLTKPQPTDGDSFRLHSLVVNNFYPTGECVSTIPSPRKVWSLQTVSWEFAWQWLRNTQVMNMRGYFAMVF